MGVECIKALGPSSSVGLKPLVEFDELGWLQSVHASLGRRFGGNEAGDAEDLEVFGDCWLAEREFIHEFADGSVPIQESGQNRSSVWFS